MSATEGIEQILDLAVALNSAEDPDRILREVLRRLRDLVPYDRASVSLLQPDSATLQLREIRLQDRHAGDEEDIGKDIPADDSNVLGWVFTHRKVHRQGELDSSSRFEEQVSGAPVVSHIIAPMVSRGRCMGVVAIGSREQAVFTESDERITARCATLAAVALDNVRLYRSSRGDGVRDALTGLYTEGHLLEVLEQELSRMERYGASFTLMLLDVDGFKSYQGREGIPQADRVLRIIGEVLRGHTRRCDMAFRYGRDSFVVLLPATDEERATLVAERLQDVLRGALLQPPDDADEPVVTVSIGVAAADASADSREALVDRAYLAVRRSKVDGGDRVTMDVEE